MRRDLLPHYSVPGEADRLCPTSHHGQRQIMARCPHALSRDWDDRITVRSSPELAAEADSRAAVLGVSSVTSLTRSRGYLRTCAASLIFLSLPMRGTVSDCGSPSDLECCLLRATGPHLELDKKRTRRSRRDHLCCYQHHAAPLVRAMREAILQQRRFGRLHTDLLLCGHGGAVGNVAAAFAWRAKCSSFVALLRGRRVSAPALPHAEFIGYFAKLMPPRPHFRLVLGACGDSLRPSAFDPDHREASPSLWFRNRPIGMVCVVRCGRFALAYQPRGAIALKRAAPSRPGRVPPVLPAPLPRAHVRTDRSLRHLARSRGPREPCDLLARGHAGPRHRWLGVGRAGQGRCGDRRHRVSHVYAHRGGLARQDERLAGTRNAKRNHKHRCRCRLSIALPMHDHRSSVLFACVVASTITIIPDCFALSAFPLEAPPAPR